MGGPGLDGRALTPVCDFDGSACDKSLELLKARPTPDPMRPLQDPQSLPPNWLRQFVFTMTLTSQGSVIQSVVRPCKTRGIERAGELDLCFRVDTNVVKDLLCTRMVKLDCRLTSEVPAEQQDFDLSCHAAPLVADEVAEAKLAALVRNFPVVDRQRQAEELRSVMYGLAPADNEVFMIDHSVNLECSMCYGYPHEGDPAYVMGDVQCKVGQAGPNEYTLKISCTPPLMAAPGVFNLYALFLRPCRRWGRRVE